MNWNNIKLTDSYERDQNILDPYNFDTLLLEIHCNLKTENLTPQEITKHFNTILASKIESAKEVFKNNLNNIVKQAQAERAEN